MSSNKNKPIVVLTRTENDPQLLSERFPSIHWLEFPLIQFKHLELDQRLLDYVNEEMDWLVFTSQNAVKSFLAKNEIKNGKSIACVGPKTQNLIESYGYKVDFVPQRYTSKCLANEIPVSAGENICYIGGNLSSQETLNMLEEKASHFLKLEVYETLSFAHSKAEWEALLLSNPEVISFCSPSAVHAFERQMQKYKLRALSDTKYVAIGSTTALAIHEVLKSDPIIGNQHTFQGMIEQIVSYLKTSRKD